MTEHLDDPFLPTDYEVPKNEGHYMRFEQGDNKFRILDKPIFGWEGWKDEDGKNVPYRFPMNAKPADTSAFKEGKISHFWAMPVWNYNAKALQVLQLNQKGIMGAIEALARNEDWGSPLGYNITVKKEGEKLETEYFVNPSPKTDVPKEARDAWNEAIAAGFDMRRLYRGGDPFTPDDGDHVSQVENSQTSDPLNNGANGPLEEGDVPSGNAQSSPKADVTPSVQI